MHDVSSVELGTKVCPRCGETLFADMGVCYGCLYDFTRKSPRPLLPDLPRIDANEVNEVNEVNDTRPLSEARDEVVDDSPFVLLDGGDEASDQSPDKTAALALRSFAVLVRTHDVDACVPLPQSGLVIGRGQDCDVVLHSSVISRRHLSLMPTQTGVVAQDLGATNPAAVHGVPIEGKVTLGAGDAIDMCGSELVIVDGDRSGRGAAGDLPTARLELVHR